ncbi:MAG: hypothetical protein K6A67_09390 [Bacteroidales bacterium]|nr:hypothetical protein [Bacteroidales bacterium]
MLRVVALDKEVVVVLTGAFAFKRIGDAAVEQAVEAAHVAHLAAAVGLGLAAARLAGLTGVLCQNGSRLGFASVKTRENLSSGVTENSCVFCHNVFPFF